MGIGLVYMAREWFCYIASSHVVTTTAVVFPCAFLRLTIMALATPNWSNIAAFVRHGSTSHFMLLIIIDYRRSMHMLQRCVLSAALWHGQ